MRGVDVAVEQRVAVPDERWCGRGGADAARGRAARCCDDGAAAGQLDAGVELRRRRGEQRGRDEQRAVVRKHVCHSVGLGFWERGR